MRKKDKRHGIYVRLKSGIYIRKVKAIEALMAVCGEYCPRKEMCEEFHGQRCIDCIMIEACRAICYAPAEEEA